MRDLANRGRAAPLLAAALALLAAGCDIQGISALKAEMREPELASGPIPVTGIGLDKASAALLVGESAQLEAQVAPANATNRSLSWSTSQAAVASVSEGGLVRGLAEGSATITARSSDGGYEASCAVTVSLVPVPLTGIGFSASSLVLARGATASPVVVFTPAGATNKALAWTSGDESVATVSPAGLVTGLGWGETSVTAVSEEGGYSATITVQVEASVSLFAGDRTFSGSVNGVGSAARFNGPRQLATDGDYLYVVEYMNHMIRKIDLATAEVKTLAGSTSSGHADGTGAAASFWCPQGIAYAEGYLYVADSGNNMIRRVDAATGAVTSFAGSTTAGSADGSGSAAGFDGPVGIATDGSYLYVADTGNQTIRRITIASKVVTTIAGIVDLPGSADGTGTLAKFSNPRGIVTDGSYAYVADGTYGLIRRIDLSGLAVLTIAGSRDSAETFVDGIGAAAGFYSPHQLALSGGFLYVADAGNYAIRRIKLATAEVSTFAGSGVSGNADGLGPAATFAYPQGIAYASGKFYVTSGSTIRKLE